ncbi:uncharacterized protein LOC111383222 [Olea europaea var. sylvestris]|uniref:uncharacterized protein LOC111383222 n=1 Tax=Olea europaea var. sylvestris TaxID=158386 RepID=UPI000C1D871E|nr:uncharacterized protein LOC111383222 [Olea europaea var. sylvestris]
MSEIQSHKKPEVPHYIYRDELSKKPSTLKMRKKVHFQIEQKPLLEREESEKNHESRNNSTRCGHVEKEKLSGTKVKILMTKEEAARLLSKFRDGRVLEFKDVARDLMQIPVNRVNFVSY